MFLLIEKEKQIEEILQFVTRHKGSHASHNVCSRILGGEFYGIDEQVINQLKSKLPEIGDDEIESCYYIIK
ncbi:hypothetical protein [Tepidanaerobacter acetatoxydans]|uniref:hypothetical protein n=1 Tax=Tepidanaerobacter acetatoxydans TaxID=499229 RepID=UPI0023F31987|nr:hypothetical protein [Tepidanaerobacter acetatoxydans]